MTRDQFRALLDALPIRYCWTPHIAAAFEEEPCEPDSCVFCGRRVAVPVALRFRWPTGCIYCGIDRGEIPLDEVAP
jgi:hypothetical protein